MATGRCMGHRDRRSASLEDLSALYQAKKLESICHYVPPGSNIIALYPKDICWVFLWVSMHLLSYSLMSPAWLPVIFSLKLSSHHCVKPVLIQMQRMIHKFMTRMVQPLAMNKTKRVKPQKTTRSMTADEDNGELPHSSMCSLHLVRTRTSFIFSFQIRK